MEQALKRLAGRDRVPQATKAAELIKLALELEEDIAFEQLAAARDKKGVRFLSHTKVWGNVWITLPPIS